MYFCGNHFAAVGERFLYNPAHAPMSHDIVRSLGPVLAGRRCAASIHQLLSGGRDRNGVLFGTHYFFSSGWWALWFTSFCGSGLLMPPIMPFIIPCIMSCIMEHSPFCIL